MLLLLVKPRLNPFTPLETFGHCLQLHSFPGSDPGLPSRETSPLPRGERKGCAYLAALTCPWRRLPSSQSSWVSVNWSGSALRIAITTTAADLIRPRGLLLLSAWYRFFFFFFFRILGLFAIRVTSRRKMENILSAALRLIFLKGSITDRARAPWCTDEKKANFLGEEFEESPGSRAGNCANR